MRPALIVTLDEEAHHASRHAGALIDEEHLDIALDEKHRVPLLTIVRAQGVVVWFRDKEFLKPCLGSGAIGDIGRVNVESLRGIGEHAGGCPLAGPHANLCERALVSTCKLPEKATMALRV